MKKIIVIGGGFAGYTFVKNFKEKDRFDITLVSKSKYFVFTPILPEAASSTLSVDDAHENIEDYCDKNKIRFIQDEVTHIDTDNGIKINSKDEIFDYLIIATGAENNYYNIEGADTHSISMKSFCAADKIKKRLKTLREKDGVHHLAVVGAGPTGVELATGIREFFGKKPVNISIINAMPDILPNFSQYIKSKALEHLKKNDISIIHGKVKSVDAIKLQLEKDDKSIVDIAFDQLFWAAGVKATMLSLHPEVDRQGGRILVDDNLRVVGKDNVFALGDIAVNKNTPLPMLGQVAARQAEYLANNFIDIIDNKAKKFEYISKGSFVLLGHNSAVGEVAGVKLFGKMAVWIWRFAYLYIFKSNKNRVLILKHWLEKTQ